MDIGQSRVGSVARSSDASNCDGQAHIGAVTGNSNVAFSSNTLTSSAPAVDINNGGGDAHTDLSQGGAAQLFRFSGGVTQSHSLSFTWSGSVRSNSCEASVRLGESSGTTAGCSVCGYPGNPSRTQSSDGHFITVSFTSLCGNGTVESAAGEDCDTGIAGSVCCGSNCKFLTSSTTCRGAADECDLAEVCSGTAATGTACTDDGNPCTTETCNGSSNLCQHPPGNAGTVCRTGSGDVCDPDETCTGSSSTCPADVVQPNTFTCRSAAGECDLAENCTGVVGQICPADAKKTNGTACTADSNPCTLDQCNGTSVTCQHPACNPGAVCRAAANQYDIQDLCTGSSTSCPADVVKSAGTACTDDGNVCTTDQCNGTSGAPACVHNPGNAGTVCRAAAGVRDAADTGAGSNRTCPTD